MAYDRYDPEERRWRDEEDRRARGWDRDPRDRDLGRDPEERGFFGRMGDEVRSWFGDERPDGERRPADYEDDGEWDREPYRRTSFAGSRARSGRDDPHYEEWRRRQMEDLDRDYHEYRRERQERFEDDFGGWRERRQAKRQMLRDVRERMEVVGSDGEHVGTVDRVAGERIILTRSDPEAGGAHHSLSCSDLERIEDNRVILDCKAEKARERWRDESRSRALFERDDQGRMGPGMLDRSFSGTYR